MTAATLAAGLLLTGCGGTADAESGREVRQDTRRDVPAAEAPEPSTGSPHDEAADTGEAPGAAADAAQSEQTGQSEEAEPQEAASQGETASTSPWAGTSAPREAFLMPSGNVACGLGSDWVACQIRERNYLPAPVFAGCSAAEANTILLRQGEAPVWICSEHSMFSIADDLTGPTLEYGETFYGPAHTCLSDTDGVQCSGHGHSFRLARGSYDAS